MRITRATVQLWVQQLDDEGRVISEEAVPINVFESSFDTTIQDLANQLLDQLPEKVEEKLPA